MNSNNSHTEHHLSNNLIGHPEHRRFIRIQAAYGVSQRGGVIYPLYDNKHAGRLVNNINILSSIENRQLIFSESIFSN